MIDGDVGLDFANGQETEEAAEADFLDGHIETAFGIGIAQVGEGLFANPREGPVLNGEFASGKGIVDPLQHDFTCTCRGEQQRSASEENEKQKQVRAHGDAETAKAVVFASGVAVAIIRIGEVHNVPTDEPKTFKGVTLRTV